MVAIIGVLVAISIPIFTAQLEKAREATDAANIRSEYAEIMVKAVEEPAGTYTSTAVALKQQQDNWQSSPDFPDNLSGAPGAPKAGQKFTISYAPPTGTATEGTVTLAYAN